MSKKIQKKLGFTLIEALLVVGIMALLAGFSVPVYQSFQVRNDLDVARGSLVESLRRAQALSMAVDGDSSWGVSVFGTKITLWKGASYATRNLAFDEDFDLPSSITASGISEVVFSKLFGLPNSSGAFVLTTNTNETRNITINQKGMVDY